MSAPEHRPPDVVPWDDPKAVIQDAGVQPDDGADPDQQGYLPDVEAPDQEDQA
jgi:hypothetical protein